MKDHLLQKVKHDEVRWNTNTTFVSKEILFTQKESEGSILCAYAEMKERASEKK
ncbi:hypothetical protein Fmac_006545 [Flemingia macrophylla]|uniref:Uncharacterized protein n=1 Tax=Flemingia macrophylla TaxID=520843 RepID=A0ABD1NDL0_9FABA